MPLSIVRVIDSGAGFTTVLASDGNQYTIHGNPAWRNNNPGDLRPGSLTNGLGAIGAATAGDNGQFLVFPSYQAGIAAQEALQFNSPSYANRSIADAIKRFAPVGDNNDPAAYAQSIANYVGVPVSTRLSDLTPTQRALYIQAQQGVEGNVPGTITGPSGSPVPSDLTGLFYGSGAPIPSVDIPGPSQPLADPVSAGALRNPALLLPLPPPAPLSPPKVDGIGSSLPSFDQFQSQMGLTAPPPLPIPRPTPPTQAAPIPMPSLGVPVAPQLVRLPSGQMIAPGTYSTGGGVLKTITGDANGNASIKTSYPGFMNPAAMGQGTIAGSILGRKLADAGTQIQQGAGQALDNAGAGLNSLKDQAGAAASNLASGAGSLLSNLFGGAPKPPSVPAPPSSYTQPTPSFLPTGNSWAVPAAPTSPPAPSFLPTGNVWTNPLVKPVTPPPAPVAPPAPTTLPSFMPSGSSWATPYNTVPPAAPATPVGTPPGTVLPLTANMPPPIPMPTPSWLQPVMPPSAAIIPNFVTQGIAAKRPGVLDAAQFLSGGGNNYSYLNSAASSMGVPASSLHAALMAQQNRPQNQGGSFAATGNWLADSTNPNLFGT